MYANSGEIFCVSEELGDVLRRPLLLAARDAISEIASVAMRAIVDGRFASNRRTHPIRAVHINGFEQFEVALRLHFTIA